MYILILKIDLKKGTQQDRLDKHSAAVNVWSEVSR